MMQHKIAFGFHFLCFTFCCFPSILLMSTRLRVVQFCLTWAWTNIYKYICIFFLFKLQVVIWETLRARYFRRTNSSLSWFLFLPKNCLLNGGGEVFPWRALMFSSLRLSACFIYDIRVWVIYCTLSWQWYIFETSSLSDRIGFIMFAVANEKQRLSVVFLTGHFLQHPFTACFCYYTLPLKVK